MDYQTIRHELEQAILKIGEKHGFTGSIGAIIYNDIGFRCTLTAKANETSTGQSGAELEYAKYATKFKYKKDTFGKEFSMQGQTFRIIGVNPKARTMPILAIDVKTGKQYKFSPILADAYDFDKFPIEVIKHG